MSEKLHKCTATFVYYVIAEEGYGYDEAQNRFDHGEVQEEEDAKYNVEIAEDVDDRHSTKTPFGYPEDVDRDDWTCEEWLAWQTTEKQ